MALDRRTYLYEILFRLDQNGLVGAHAIDIDEIYDTESGEVVQAKEQPARPVTVDEASSLVGAQSAAIVTQLTAAQAALAAAEADKTTLAADVAAAEARAQTAEAALATVRNIVAPPADPQ